MAPLEIEARINRLLSRLENPTISKIEIALIERKLRVLRKLQRDEQES